MRVKITKPGIYGATGEIEVGTELMLKSGPKGWEGRYEVIQGDDDSKTALTANRDELKKQADELGVEYVKNISSDKLQELIDAKLRNNLPVSVWA